MMDIRKAIGLAIRDRRVAMNMTQEEFGVFLGWGRRIISFMEHGSRLPHERLTELAAKTGGRYSDLMAEAEAIQNMDTPSKPPSE